MFTFICLSPNSFQSFFQKRPFFQTLFEGILKTNETGSRPKPMQTQLGYTKEQVDVVQRLRNAKDNYERLGLPISATKWEKELNGTPWPKLRPFFSSCRDDVNRSYRKLAVLLHPDKNVAPGSEEAFKLLLDARTALLKNAKWSFRSPGARISSSSSSVLAVASLPTAATAICESGLYKNFYNTRAASVSFLKVDGFKEKLLFSKSRVSKACARSFYCSTSRYFCIILRRSPICVAIRFA